MANPVNVSPVTLKSKYFGPKASGKSKDDGSPSGCNVSGNRTERVVTRALAKKRNRTLSGSSFAASIACEKDTCDDQKKVMISRHFKPDLPPHTTRKKKKPRQYAAPAVYQHLHHLPDLIAPSLDVLFCGSNQYLFYEVLIGNHPREKHEIFTQATPPPILNNQTSPGCQSAKISHYYAHHSNHFWKSLFLSGFTPHRLSPHDDHLLPSEFGLGLTDLVCRPTAEANELSGSERLKGVPVLLGKIRRFQPRFLCFVGIKQYQDLGSYLKKKLPKSRNQLPSMWQSSSQKTVVGLQNIVFRSQKITPINKGQSQSTATDTIQYSNTFVFVCPSTSALVRNYPEKDRVACFKELLGLKNRPNFGSESSTTAIASGSSRDNLCFDYIQIDDELLS